GGGLLLERLREIVGALPQLIEQTRVLDRDDGLRGKIRNQGDLLVGERSNVLVEYADRTHQLLVLDHRHDQQGPDSAEFYPGDRQRITIEIGSVRAIVGNVDDIERFDDARQRVQGTRSVRTALKELCKRRRIAELGDDTGGTVLEPPERAELGSANAPRVLQHRLEHRLQFAGRTRDDAQHFRGRGLLLQRFAQLVQEAGVLDGDDGLRGE